MDPSPPTTAESQLRQRVPYEGVVLTRFARVTIGAGLVHGLEHSLSILDPALTHACKRGAGKGWRMKRDYTWPSLAAGSQ
jgi:hypothetical protein